MQRGEKVQQMTKIQNFPSSLEPNRGIPISFTFLLERQQGRESGPSNEQVCLFVGLFVRGLVS